MTGDNEATEVDKRDIALLRALEGLSRAFEWVPEDKLLERLPMDYSELATRLEKLDSLGLIDYRYIPTYQTYAARMKERAYDTLALWDMKKHHVYERLGTIIGEGKEATIVNAKDHEDEWVAIKLHRYHAPEFRRIKKTLAYAAVKVREEELRVDDHRIDVPRAKAQVEMKVLQHLHSKGFPVPEPRAINRHAVAMDMIEGHAPGIPAPLLAKIKVKNPEEALEVILEDYREIVLDGHYVHGDFSEHNILVTPDGELYYVDWPQAVPIEHPSAPKLCYRDLKNVIEHFRRKYRIRVPDPKEVYDEIADDLQSLMEEKKEEYERHKKAAERTLERFEESVERVESKREGRKIRQEEDEEDRVPRDSDGGG
ncbi:serine/threonine-protein kinase RIO2 [Methanopyrus sp.]